MDHVLSFNVTRSIILMHLNPFLMLYSFLLYGTMSTVISLITFLPGHSMVLNRSRKESPQSWLSIPPWCLCQGRLPLLSMSNLRKYLPKEVSPKIPESQWMQNLTLAKLKLARNNNHLLGVAIKLLGYFVYKPCCP